MSLDPTQQWLATLVTVTVADNPRFNATFPVALQVWHDDVRAAAPCPTSTGGTPPTTGPCATLISEILDIAGGVAALLASLPPPPAEIAPLVDRTIAAAERLRDSRDLADLPALDEAMGEWGNYHLGASESE